MTIVRHPSPFGELLSLRQAMDRLLDDDFGPRAGWTTVTTGGGGKTTPAVGATSSGSNGSGS